MVGNFKTTKKWRLCIGLTKSYSLRAAPSGQNLIEIFYEVPFAFSLGGVSRGNFRAPPGYQVLGFVAYLTIFGIF